MVSKRARVRTRKKLDPIWFMAAKDGTSQGPLCKRENVREA
ncbi:MAG: hypothetical protein JWM36_2734 [Hyphomicrobiales bacterium]|nr:hypothetical protein [Hyphomicrobiales bacterium]